MTLRISTLDAGVVLLYFAAVTFIAWRTSVTRKEENESRDFLLGERAIPWWAAMLSIIGTEMSALTFVGVPAYAFAKTGNYTYLMGAVGMIIARIIVSRWFVPAYYRYDVVSIYEFLERRFGPWTRALGVAVFMFTRTAMSGVRLYAGSIVVETALGISWPTAVLATMFIGMLYTAAGGIKSVIWTEVMQVSVMFGGTALALALLCASLPHGWHDVQAATAGLDKFRLLDKRFDLRASDQEFTIWASIFGMTFFNLSIFGTDFDMVQRMLTTADAHRSARAVITSALADIPISATFLTIGVLLFTYYTVLPDASLPARAEEVFPHFILTRIPAGAAGLVVAGLLSVALSSFQSAINALSTSFTVDVYRPYLMRESSRSAHETDRHLVRVTRCGIAAFALLLTGVAFWSATQNNLLILGLSIPSYTYCALLGVFLTGIYTQRGSDISCALAIPVAIAFVTIVCHRMLGLAWTWNALVGTVVSFAVANLVGSPRPRVA